MKKEDVAKGKRYISSSNPSLIVIATGAVDNKVKSFQGQETSQGGIGDWYLKEFSPLSEKELEEKLEFHIGGEETESLMEWLENQRS